MGVSITTCTYWCAATCIFSPQLVGLWINIVHLKIAHTAEYNYDITQEVVGTQVCWCGCVGVWGWMGGSVLLSAIVKYTCTCTL